MESPFIHELEDLKKFLLTMAGEVERQLELAVRSLVERDGALAEQVIDGDALIDRREIEADRHIVEAIVRGRPLARDLRFVMTAGKIAPDLERIGDHAVNIARQSLQLAKVPPLKPLVTTPRMAAVVVGMVHDAIAAFVASDGERARAVIARDDQVDAMNEELFRELLTYMMEDPRTIARGIALTLVVRSLERIGDQATNIAEQVIYLVEGEDVRHQRAGDGDD